MFDHESKPSTIEITATEGTNPNPAARFADVLKAVENDSSLKAGVRGNMRSAVIKAAHLVSAQGLQGPVDIERLQRKFEGLTPARLDLKSDGALASFKSNLRRALRLAGHDVMPGRHVTPLSPRWARLMELLGSTRAIKLSRFAHVASKHQWEPEDISSAHLERFRKIMLATSIGSKAAKVVRCVITAWAYGRKHCVDWPAVDLGAPPAEARFYALPWSAFPTTFQEDVELYLSRPEANLAALLEGIGKAGVLLLPPDPRGRNNRTLSSVTKENYRDTLRRAASILVLVGHCDAHEITNLASLAGVAQLQYILNFLAKRTGREKGGHLSYVAFLLYLAARDHVRPADDTVAHLEYLWKRVRGRTGEMSPRSCERLRQFDDDTKMTLMAKLPDILFKAARKRGKIDARAIKLVRTAVFTYIGLCTALRSGNIVNLELDRHITFTTRNKQRIAIITNPADEVKTRREIISELTPEATQMLDCWLTYYRPQACSPDQLKAPYLFPNTKGGHMDGTLAWQSFKDLAAKYAGLDVTPHGMRAYFGKLLLDDNPDAHATVQAGLTHNSIETTLRYYAPVQPLKAMRRAQKLLVALQKSPRPTGGFDVDRL